MAILTILTASGSVGLPGADMRLFLDAVRQVESGGNDSAVGDAGQSIGPYQISRAYWRDSGIPGRYEQVIGRAYAERVMFAYWHRYCSKALKSGDFETLARVHNGGPRGHTKNATRGYWRKIQEEMDRGRRGDTRDDVPARRSSRRTAGSRAPR